MRNPAVTETKKSQATIPRAWFRMNVDQHWSLLPCGRGACSMYFLTVRGEGRTWSLSQSSSTIRSSPQVRFSAAIRRIKRRTSADIGGRPTMIHSLSSARSGLLTERQRCYYRRRTQSGCELTTTVGLDHISVRNAVPANQRPPLRIPPDQPDHRSDLGGNPRTASAVESCRA
jgi:hypothetical protein